MRPSFQTAANQAEHDSLALVVCAYRAVMSELAEDYGRPSTNSRDVFESVFQSGEGEALFASFFAFARALLSVAERPLAWRERYGSPLCRDERLAVTMIDAAQRRDFAELLTVATDLVGPGGLGDALGATQALALALARRGMWLLLSRKELPSELAAEPPMEAALQLKGLRAD